MADQAVRLFAVEHPRAPRNMKEKLQFEKAELLGQLVSAQDWPDYKHRLGKIHGIDIAIAICDEEEGAG